MIRDMLQYILFTCIVLMSISLLCNMIGQQGISIGITFSLIIIILGVALITKEYWK